MSDSDDDIDDDDSKQPNATNKRSLESDSSDDEDNREAQPSRKRKASDLRSVASSSSRYVTGGKGIHRPNAAASVRSGASGVSRMSMATTKSASTVYGGEFKAKKAKGDMKKKGKVDPYAYIPLTRNVLNKR